MISRNSAIALANLYGMYFGRNYNSAMLYRYAENRDLSNFVYKINFEDRFCRKASECILPDEVRDFILDFYTGSFIDKSNPEVKYQELCQKYIFILTEEILKEVLCNSELEMISPESKQLILNLLDSLHKDDLYFFEQELISHQQLVDLGYYFDVEKKKFVNMNNTLEKGEGKTPSIQEFLIEFPLYRSIILDAEESRQFAQSLGFFQTPTIDSYCVECEGHSTFKRIPPTHQMSIITNLFFVVNLECARKSAHRMNFYIQIRDDKLFKVGQYPSIADLNVYDVKKYRKYLGEYATEFSKAIGLASHGVGVGSFVYLRRIFENLIEKAHQKALKEDDWRNENEIKFNENQVRIVEKIQLLKDYLPSFLVQNRSMYGIVSKGIHQLTEDECLNYFPIIKSGIELILDEEIEIKRKAEKQLEVQKQIQKIQTELTQKESTQTE